MIKDSKVKREYNCKNPTDLQMNNYNESVLKFIDLLNPMSEEINKSNGIIVFELDKDGIFKYGFENFTFHEDEKLFKLVRLNSITPKV